LFNLLLCGLPRLRGQPPGCTLILLLLLELDDVPFAFSSNLLTFVEGAQLARMLWCTLCFGAG